MRRGVGRGLATLLAAAAVLAGAVTPARAADGPPPAHQPPPSTVCVAYDGSADGGTRCIQRGQYPGSRLNEAFVQRCDYTGPDGVVYHDGAGWEYREGIVIDSSNFFGRVFQVIDSFVDVLPAMLDAAQQQKPFDEVYRVFTRYCENQRQDVVTILIVDPFFNPAGKWRDVLEASIDYRPWPLLQTVPDPDTSGFKALVVNTPTYLAIDPGAWHAEKANDIADLGWTLTYVATPIGLTFEVDGQRIDCVAGARARGTATMFPPLPDGFTDTKFRDPSDGPDPRPCTWVPRRAGTFPVTISITYRRAFIAEGFVAPQPDRTFTFTENVTVVELKVVNVKPDGA